jgi:hypothetical protein
LRFWLVPPNQLMDLRNEHPMSFQKSAKSSLEKYENFQILNKISKVSFGGLGGECLSSSNGPCAGDVEQLSPKLKKNF